MSIIERAAGRLGLGSPRKSAAEPRRRAEPSAEAPATGPRREAARADAGPPHASDAGGGAAAPRLTTLFTALDFEQLHAAGFLVPEQERSQLAEEYRLIKRPLITNLLGKGAAPVPNGNLIMVTSCLPGEGKTYTAINLAMSIAMEMDHRVLLIDADIPSPAVPNALGIRSDRGILDVLVEPDLEIADVLVRTNIDKLMILPAGRRHARATELLASEAMNDLVQEMAKRYPDRILIFDAPPLLVTSEARVLASHMGQVVLVVEAAKTAKHAVNEAIGHLSACPVVGIVLNKVDPLIGEPFYYGYQGK